MAVALWSWFYSTNRWPFLAGSIARTVCIIELGDTRLSGVSHLDIVKRLLTCAITTDAPCWPSRNYTAKQSNDSAKKSEQHPALD